MKPTISIENPQIGDTLLNLWLGVRRRLHHLHTLEMDMTIGGLDMLVTRTIMAVVAVAALQVATMETLRLVNQALLLLQPRLPVVFARHLTYY